MLHEPNRPFPPQIGAAIVSALAVISWLVVAGVVRLITG